MSRRPVTEEIPDHLKPFIARQDASLYTPMDHASWRFILKISRAYFARHAHQKYLDGLKETGISTERIPLVEEMDQKLKRFGWRAVPVSGFIPPAVFMEFQSLGILPIACEMRTLEHLAYTPAPDIVHEAAGHAPIIADMDYANYLRNYGEVSRKAIFSDKDTEVYLAIRALSDTKENPDSTDEQIAECQKALDEAVANLQYVSEATYLARMNWWTVEYGLIGDHADPLIYGAGLLSSVGESYNCLSPEVKKVPFTLDCINTSYDITRPQPQLYVTSDFSALSKVLEEFASLMAFRRGGVEGLAKAKMASSVTTTVLDSGLQISGILDEFFVDAVGEPYFIRFRGPTQLGFNDQEIENQGPAYHREGFSSPIGPLQNGTRSAAELTATQLEGLGFRGREKGRLTFKSGIELTGVLKSRKELEGRLQILSFEDCTVKLGDRVLFDPAWGVFDLACGNKVTSVFGGAADRGKYVAAVGGLEGQKPRPPKTNLTPANRRLNELYAEVRKIRESGEKGEAASSKLDQVHAELQKNFPDDWLLRLELLELQRTWKLARPWEQAVSDQLKRIAGTAKDKAAMISRGLESLG